MILRGRNASRCKGGQALFLLFAVHLLMGCVQLTAQEAAEPDASIPRSATQGTPQQIVVATREVPPFAFRNDDGEWQGISIDLLREIKADLETESDHEVQLRFESYSLQEMLDAVATGKVDIAAAAVTVNHEREKSMDFSHSYYSSGLGIAVGSKQRKPGWSGIFDTILSPTLLRIVLGLLAAMLVSAFGIYFFERTHEKSDFNRSLVRGVGEGLWWAAVTLTTVGYGDKVPKSLPGRMIGLIWMFSGLFIIASFTAAVTSAVTVNQLRSRIAGPADLPRAKVATVAGATSAAYLRARHIRFESHDNVNSALQSLADGRCDAVVYDAPILRYQVFQQTTGDLYVLPITFDAQNYAFALTSESPLREPINRSLLRHISSSQWQDTLASYLGNDEQ